jgi:hypothetical protein
MFCTGVFGEDTQWRQLRSSSGIVQGTPLSGSLIMPDKKLVTAAVDLSGRTEIVGKRREKPLMNPRRVKSLIRVSQIIF